jgi:hypothetical protein
MGVLVSIKILLYYLYTDPLCAGICTIAISEATVRVSGIALPGNDGDARWVWQAGWVRAGYGRGGWV